MGKRNNSANCGGEGRSRLILFYIYSNFPISKIFVPWRPPYRCRRGDSRLSLQSHSNPRVLASSSPPSSLYTVHHPSSRPRHQRKKVRFVIYFLLRYIHSIFDEIIRIRSVLSSIVWTPRAHIDPVQLAVPSCENNYLIENHPLG